jgi:hypothetical protein
MDGPIHNEQKMKVNLPGMYCLPVSGQIDSKGFHRAE